MEITINDFKKGVVIRKILHNYGVHRWSLHKIVKGQNHYKCTMCKERKVTY